MSILSFFLRTPKAPKPSDANVIDFCKIERAHFFNGVNRAIRANRLTPQHEQRARKNAAEIWAKHIARFPGYESARASEQAAVDYCALLSTYQKHDMPRPAPWGPEAA
ncbi:MAG: hypothetical protein IPH10_10745 [bacterium]|nr:hypothetical protein [bacterium]